PGCKRKRAPCARAVPAEGSLRSRRAESRVHRTSRTAPRRGPEPRRARAAVKGDRCILSVKYVPAGSAKRLGGFLRYVQFRDQHQDARPDRELSGLTKYIAHRDRTAPGGRLFGPRGNCGDLDRRALLAHISRSMRAGGTGKHPRAAYRMVLSPERADGVDLKALTRASLTQLGREAGGTPPWIAAIHRNTRHPHVHIVMAARRELAPGLFRMVVINRDRLAQMKVALNDELVRERDGAPQRISLREFGLPWPEHEPGRPRPLS